MSQAEPPPSIFTWVGGRATFERWLDRFYDLVEADELLAPAFGGAVSTERRDHVTSWWAEVMAAPRTTPPSTADTRTCWASTWVWPSRPSNACAS